MTQNEFNYRRDALLGALNTLNARASQLTSTFNDACVLRDELEELTHKAQELVSHHGQRLDHKEDES